MKKDTLQFSLLLFIAIMLYSCGGVIGNIEKYPFPNITSESLKTALNRVYVKYPELQKTDTSMYGMNDGDKFYFVFDHEGTRYVFKCHVVNYHDDMPIDLSLTSATKWGQTMKLAPNMGFFEKRKYRRIFEEYILPKVKEPS